MFFAAKDGEALYSQKKTRPGDDCGSDHEFLIAKFRLKWKKVGKTTRPFMYDLTQIPYDFTVEVRNRFILFQFDKYGLLLEFIYRRYHYD